MNDSEILITGANGQLGLALRAKYPGAQAVDAAELDITDKAKLEKFDWFRIKVILNAAAYTNVDGAETAEGRVAAWKVNAEGVSNLSVIAQKYDLIMVHISTEYVFDGVKKIHREDEPLSPLSSYGSSKAAGEITVVLAPKHYLIRTTWLIGEGKNFVRTMLDLGQKGIEPKVVADQFGRLTFTGELVEAIDHLLKSQSKFGIYNVSNDGDIVSWANITRVIYQEAGFNLKVIDTTAEEYFAGKLAAKRPTYSAFDLTKIKATGFKPTDWLKDLKAYLKKELHK